MKTKIKLNLKRLTSLCIALVMMFSISGISGTIAYAAENDFEEVTLSLNSTATNDSSINLYLFDSIHYITIDDLCLLTRCSQSIDGDIISVTQGFWSATFDIEKQQFDDDYQTVSTTILEVSENEYAVPALMFLSYFKAIAFIENDTLYCRMPEFTAWEALNVDFSNSLVDIYELYGGEGNVTLSLTLDLIMDFIMGDLSDSDDYLSDAFLAALEVDLHDIDALQKYKESSQNELYTDIHSDQGKEFLDTIKGTFTFTAEPTEWFIQSYYNANEKTFVRLAYDAYEAGHHDEVKQYGEKFYEAFTKKNKTSETAEQFFNNVDYAMLFISAAVETAQDMKYVNATDNLIYNVMGKENLNYLGISADDNDWFTVANKFQNVLGVTSLNLEAEAMQYFTDKICWEALIGTGVTSAASISYGSWALSLNVGRLFAEKFPLTKSSIEAFKADQRALYLSELQQNVFWVAMNTLQNMQGQLDNLEIYTKYIQAMQLYCRTSIAMYENLITMVDQFGQNRNYWTNLFQSRIDMLAVSLYQLTTIQDDGIAACLPLDLSTFEYNTNDENIFENMPSNFEFASGAGAWSTELTLNGDGSFTGYYHDSDMGDSNDAYPDGTVYICNFTGKFTVPVQINDYTYSMKLESLQTEGNSGEEYYENNQRFVYSEPYGLENANELLIYTPGSPISELPEDLTVWLNTILTSDDKELPCFVIFSVNDQSAFVGYDDVKSETDSSQNTNDGNTLIENARSQVLEHYTELWKPEGTYTCYESEDSISGNEITFVLRYAMSDEEAEERIANGGIPSANTLVTSVVVNLSTGAVYDIDGYTDTWYLEL